MPPTDQADPRSPGTSLPRVSSPSQIGWHLAPGLANPLAPRSGRTPSGKTAGTLGRGKSAGTLGWGGLGRRVAGWLPLVLALAGAAFAQPSCPPLPPPAGATIEVHPQQANQLRAIVAAASAGTTILLHDGLYAMNQGDYLSRLEFTTPNVTLRSLSGNRDAVVLDGAYQTHELLAIHASGVTIADLTLERAYDHPVHVTGTTGEIITGVRLHNLRIVDPGEQAVKVHAASTNGYVDEGILECSVIELTAAGRAQVRNDCYTGGFDAHGARGWIIRRNRFSGFWCESGLSEHAVHLWRSSRDSLVEENVILDCTRGIGFGLGASFSGDRVYPDNPYPGVGYLGHIDGVIRNNFVAAADPALFASEYGFDAGIALEQARGAKVVHNSVAATAAPFSAIEWRFGNTLADIQNNLVTHNLRPRDGNPQATVAGNLEWAPTNWFENVAAGDLHLSPGAGEPLGAGVPLPAGLADTDFDGDPRGTPPDVGADELTVPLLADGFETGNLSRWSGWYGAS